MTKPIIEFSFDDGGYKDMYAADILEKYGVRGTFYIIVDKVGRAGYVTWQQVKELDKRGHEIGSHTMTHPQDMKFLHDEMLHYEVQNSKDMLEAVLGKSVNKFCYPRGRFDQRVKDQVIEAGYIEARGTGKPGITTNSDKFALPGTIHIFQRKEYGGKSVEQFAKEVIDRVSKEGGYVNIWGHTKEIEENLLWQTLESVVEYATKTIKS